MAGEGSRTRRRGGRGYVNDLAAAGRGRGREVKRVQIKRRHTERVHDITVHSQSSLTHTYRTSSDQSYARATCGGMSVGSEPSSRVNVFSELCVCVCV